VEDAFSNVKKERVLALAVDEKTWTHG